MFSVMPVNSSFFGLLPVSSARAFFLYSLRSSSRIKVKTETLEPARDSSLRGHACG